MAINKKKYKNVILYLCQQLGGTIRGKKKLAKLLYFVDFDYFEKTQNKLTGDTYKALQMGPFPTSIDTITREMIKEKTITVKSENGTNGLLPTEIYTSLTKPNKEIFSELEIRILDRVVKKYGQLNGGQLEILTHQEAPYVGTASKDSIDYELAFYRGTNFDAND